MCVVCVCVCVFSCSVVSVSHDSMDCVAHQAPLSMEFSRQILEWAAIFSSRGSSLPRDKTHVPCGSCIGRQILYY